MTRPRILLVVDNLEVGGVREVVLSQLRALDPQRFDTALLTLADDLDRLDEHALPKHVGRFGVEYRADYGYGLLDYLADGVLLRAARKSGADALAQIRALSPDLLHFHTLPRNLGLGILAGRGRGIALVFTDHAVRVRPDDYSPHSRAVLRFAYRRLYRHYHIISVGRGVAQSNRASGCLNRRRRHLLLENQVDIDTFRPPGGPRSSTAPIDIVNVARIHEMKGHETLIRAFAALPATCPAQLTLVGPDSMDGAMHRLADEIVQDPRAIRFLGARSDVPELLREASVGVFTSRREGLPLALLEMMASGLPVVVSDIPELRSLVDDGADGLVVAVDDVDALSATLALLVGDQGLRERLGAAARAKAERHMSVDAIGLLQDFYASVLDHG